MVLFAMISMVLIGLDRHQYHIQSIRTSLSLLVAPIQYLVDWPVQLLQWLGTSFTSNRALLEENATLRAHQILLQGQLQRLLALEGENEQLRALLKSTPRLGKMRLQAGQLLAVDSETSLQTAIVDKGSHDGVFQGQVVLDANGVMGQVIEVGPLTSRVMLVTDPRSAIPVQDSRNGLRAIAGGAGAMGNITLVNIPGTTDVRAGDLLVSSGLGGRYPAGYSVGVVSTVIHHSGEHFATITVEPSARVNRSTQVLLLWPEKIIATGEKSAVMLHEKNAKKIHETATKKGVA